MKYKQYKMNFGLDLIINKKIFLEEKINNDYEMELLERALIKIEEAIEDSGFLVVKSNMHDGNITLIDEWD